MAVVIGSLIKTPNYLARNDLLATLFTLKEVLIIYLKGCSQRLSAALSWLYYGRDLRTKTANHMLARVNVAFVMLAMQSITHYMCTM